VPTRQAGDAMDAGGLQRFRQAHGRQDGGEPPRQPRRARPGGLAAHIMVTMPLSLLALTRLPGPLYGSLSHQAC
jgi:hypothetical protein